VTAVAVVDRRGNAHLEAATEEFLRKRVRLLGGYAFKWVPTIAGVPDRMVLMPGGRTYFVELKQKGEKPTPIQVVWHNRLRALGYQVVVLDSKQAVLDWIREIVDASGPRNSRPGPKPRR
jgi:hypothetical protein